MQMSRSYLESEEIVLQKGVAVFLKFPQLTSFLEYHRKSEQSPRISCVNVFLRKNMPHIYVLEWPRMAQKGASGNLYTAH